MVKLLWRRLRSKYPWLQLLQKRQCWILVVLAVILCVYMIVALKKPPISIFEQEVREVKLGDIEFDFLTGLYFLKVGKDVLLRGSMSDTLQTEGPPVHCGVYNASKQLCAIWYRHVRLEVTHSVDQYASCESITWTATSLNYQPSTCFSMSDINWYGGSLLYDQKWPLNKVQLPIQPYVTQNLKSYQGELNHIGNVLDWFWITSSGVAVMFEEANAVRISLNQSGDNLICFYADSGNQPVLQYRVCHANSVKKIHRYVISQRVQLPSTSLPQELFTKSLWTTHPYLQDYMHQDSVMKFAQEIGEKHSFHRYLFEIYRANMSLLHHQPADKKKYTHFQQVCMYMHEYGFKTVLPISPFVPAELKVNKSRLLLNDNGEPRTVIWHGAVANVINLLDSKVVQWFVSRNLRQAKHFYIDGWRLTGGEANVLSKLSLPTDTWNKFSREFASLGVALKSSVVLSTFAYRSQGSNSVIILTSHSSSWGSAGGLRSVIPSVLTLGILGYPYVIPNVIGGPGRVRAINDTYSEWVKPEQELYTRWMALSACLPGMMFSTPPWLYDSEVVDIAKQFIRLHRDVVGPLVVKASKEFEQYGKPIIRPLWWVDPADNTALVTDDQFIIGDSLIVAPVVTPGANSRNVYLPVGLWKDEINKVDIQGPTWLNNYVVELRQVALFSRVVS